MQQPKAGPRGLGNSSFSLSVVLYFVNVFRNGQKNISIAHTTIICHTNKVLAHKTSLDDFSL